MSMIENREEEKKYTTIYPVWMFHPCIRSHYSHSSYMKVKLELYLTIYIHTISMIGIDMKPLSLTHSHSPSCLIIISKEIYQSLKKKCVNWWLWLILSVIMIIINIHTHTQPRHSQLFIDYFFFGHPFSGYYFFHYKNKPMTIDDIDWNWYSIVCRFFIHSFVFVNHCCHHHHHHYWIDLNRIEFKLTDNDHQFFFNAKVTLMMMMTKDNNGNVIFLCSMWNFKKKETWTLTKQTNQPRWDFNS